MSTATIQQATFVSKYPNYEQVISPADELRNERGLVYKKFSRIVVKFEGGRADVTADSKGQAIVNGKAVGDISFEDLVERLEGLPGHGARYSREQALEDKRPTEEEVRAFVDGATSEQLEAALERERETHNRPEILTIIALAALSTPEEEPAAEESEPEEPDLSAEPEGPEEHVQTPEGETDEVEEPAEGEVTEPEESEPEPSQGEQPLSSENSSESDGDDGDTG